MRVLDRYIGSAVILGTLVALAVLVAMFTFFSMVELLGDVGKGHFGILNVFEYILLTLPAQAYEIFPLSALMGSLLGLGVLASNSELTVMRSAGLSIGRISLAAMKGGAVLMAVAIILGELISPFTSELAERRRSEALEELAESDEEQVLWARDGLTFINIGRKLSDDEMEELYIYEFDQGHRLRMVTRAERARYRGDTWLLEGVTLSEINESRVIGRTMERAEWQSVLGPKLVGATGDEPERLSAWGLYSYVSYLRDNGLNSAPYELGLWNKLMAPISTGVMIFLAIPFILGPLRSVTMGQRIVVGALVGLGFNVVSQAFSQMGLVYGFSPMLSALIPSLLFLSVALWMMQRTA